jgi:hypothetical protein
MGTEGIREEDVSQVDAWHASSLDQGSTEDGPDDA